MLFTPTVGRQLQAEANPFVDDDRFERWQIALMCEEWGYEFAEAETAEAGIAKVPAFRPMSSCAI
jgi:hypothetical protein